MITKEDERTSIYDMEEDRRLIVIKENREAKPGDIQISLTEMPWVSIQGEGKFIGQHFCFIRVSYCPLSCSFCDIKSSWSDKGKPSLSIEEITEWCRKRFPRRVCITGGEPFYKYDDETKHLVKRLHAAGKLVHFETSGISLPAVIEEHINGYGPVELDKYMPDWVCISPKFRDCVPEEDLFPYVKTLIYRLKIWKEFLTGNGAIVPAGEFKFVISADDTENDIYQVIGLMQEVFSDPEEDYSGWRIVFQPECRKELYSIPFDKERKDELYMQYLKDLRKVTDAVGKLAVNFPGADVVTLPQLHQLVCHQ
ncbi:MAG: radical SAM protein [Candidatus Thorarchaeota archaeon]|jgi:hypothetical protein